jgi:hypothetical protein
MDRTARTALLTTLVLVAIAFGAVAIGAAVAGPALVVVGLLVVPAALVSGVRFALLTRASRPAGAGRRPPTRAR